ncbi:MAG: FAD-dependent oxidoreductase [Rhodospirillales bacterium]
MTLNVLVAGGGFRGIISAYFLRKRGCNVTLVERAPFLGAVLWPLEWKEYGLILDKGCHLFGSGDPVNDDVMLDFLGDNFESHELKVAAAFNGGTTPDTVVPDLTRLPGDQPARVLRETIEAAARNPDAAGAATLAEYLSVRFGPTAAAALGPVCDKMTAARSGELAPGALSTTLGQRVKITDDDIANMLKQLGPLDDRIAASNVHDPYKYLETSNPKLPHRHFYPKKGGTGALPRAAQAYLESAGCDIRLGTSIEAFRADGRGVSVKIDDDERDFDYMVWALDMGPLSQVALGEDLVSAKVHKSPMALYYFLTPAEEIGPLSYIQDYDIDHLTFRVSRAGVYSNQILPDGNTYVCSEVVTPMGSELWETPEAFSAQVWAEARTLGMVKGDAPLDTYVQKTPVSYKHEKIGFADVSQTVAAEIEKLSSRVIITDPMVLGYAAIMEMLDRVGVH